MIILLDALFWVGWTAAFVWVLAEVMLLTIFLWGTRKRHGSK